MVLFLLNQGHKKSASIARQDSTILKKRLGTVVLLINGDGVQYRRLIPFHFWIRNVDMSALQ